MENNDRRPRQTSSSGYAGQQGLLPTQQQRSPYGMQYGEASGQRKPPSSAASPRSQGNPANYAYAYANASPYVASGIQQATIGVTSGGAYPDFPADQQRASQPYPAAYQNVMYNIPSQQATSATPQYDTVQQQYSPRQSTAIGVLSNQFAVTPQQSYYGGPTSAPAAALGTQGVTSQYSALGYTTPQGAGGRQSLPTAYTASGMTDPNQPTASGGYLQTGYQAAQTATAQQTSLEESYQSYQARLKQTFEDIRDGRLAEAGQSIYELSDFLLSSIEAFGLARDEEGMYQERLKLWENFNNCWLTCLQREKQFLQELKDSGQRPQPPQTLIEYDYLERLGDGLVKACDQIESHGLVDYQMGVWEEEIISMLTSCLDLWEATGVRPSARARPTAASSRRR